MTKALVYLPMLPPPARQRCFEFIRDEFPALAVAQAEKFAEIDPHIEGAEILITFGAHLGLDARKIFR